MRLSVGLLVGVGISLGALLLLALVGESIPSIDTVASVALEPGWRLASEIFPAGVHAGDRFLIVGVLLNSAVVGLLVWAGLELWSRLEIKRQA